MTTADEAAKHKRDPAILRRFDELQKDPASDELERAIMSLETRLRLEQRFKVYLPDDQIAYLQRMGKQFKGGFSAPDRGLTVQEYSFKHRLQQMIKQGEAQLSDDALSVLERLRRAQIERHHLSKTPEVPGYQRTMETLESQIDELMAKFLRKLEATPDARISERSIVDAMKNMMGQSSGATGGVDMKLPLWKRFFAVGDLEMGYRKGFFARIKDRLRLREPGFRRGESASAIPQRLNHFVGTKKEARDAAALFARAKTGRQSGLAIQNAERLNANPNAEWAWVQVSGGYVNSERMGILEAFGNNPEGVLFIEDAHLLKREHLQYIKIILEEGFLPLPGGRVVNLQNVDVILHWGAKTRVVGSFDEGYAVTDDGIRAMQEYFGQELVASRNVHAFGEMDEQVAMKAFDYFAKRHIAEMIELGSLHEKTVFRLAESGQAKLQSRLRSLAEEDRLDLQEVINLVDHYIDQPLLARQLMLDDAGELEELMKNAHSLILCAKSRGQNRGSQFKLSIKKINETN